MTKYKATVELEFEASSDSWAEYKLEDLRRYCMESTRDGPPLFSKMDSWMEALNE